MLKLSRKLDYSVLAVARLASREGGEPVSARQLAEQTHIPPAILANILKDLTRAGYVRSSRGIHGGYELAVDPGEITVGALVHVLEGPLRLVECVEVPGEVDSAACMLQDACPTKAPLRRLHERIESVLGELTFKELTREAFPAGSRSSFQTETEGRRGEPGLLRNNR